MHPRPPALHLSTAHPVSKLPRPPFGLRGWNAEAQASAVLLHIGDGRADDVGSLFAQIPKATIFPSGTPIVLLGTAISRVNAWRRLLGGGSVRVPRATRCTALVARGYIDVGGGIDESTGSDLAWGCSP
jgi:hypothetical protein